MRRPSTALFCLAVAILGGATLAQEQTPQTPASPTPETGDVTVREVGLYRPPAKTRVVDADAPVRPLLAALRQAGSSLDSPRAQTPSREYGTSLFTDRLSRFYEQERVQRLVSGFREGYAQLFLELPETIWLTAVDMGSAEVAAEHYLVELETLQMQLDATQDSPDGAVEMLYEGELKMPGLDRGYEKRYDLRVGEQPPSRFFTLFGQAGRYTLTVTLLQSDLSEEAGRQLLADLAARVLALDTAADTAPAPGGGAF